MKLLWKLISHKCQFEVYLFKELSPYSYETYIRCKRCGAEGIPSKFAILRPELKCKVESNDKQS